jgi:hypothetical protein
MLALRRLLTGSNSGSAGQRGCRLARVIAASNGIRRPLPGPLPTICPARSDEFGVQKAP